MRIENKAFKIKKRELEIDRIGDTVLNLIQLLTCQQSKLDTNSTYVS